MEVVYGLPAAVSGVGGTIACGAYLDRSRFQMRSRPRLRSITIEGMRLCCSLILAVYALAQAPPLATGVIEGSVIDSATGEPIRKASVTLAAIPIVMGIRTGGGMMGGDLYDPAMMPANRIANAPPAVLTTDADGRFRAVLTPGRYGIRAGRSGYLATPAGVTALSLIPGETLKGVTIKLTKQALITGRVIDADGEPLAGVRVQCLRWTTMGQNGQRALTPQSSGGTNDKGEYRIFGITPGEYIVSAEADATGPMPETGVRAAYVTLFAPGVTDLADARAIHLASGAIREGRDGIDFRMRRVPVVEVSGKVTSASGLAGTMVSLLPRNPALYMSLSRQHSAQVDPDGSFALPNVPPGAYVLHATGVSSQNQQRFSGRMNLDVGGRDLKGLTLSLEPAITLKGQIRVDGALAPSVVPPVALDSLALWLQPQGGGPSGGASSRVDAKGRFTVSSLDPVPYRIQAGGLPKGYYIKSIQLGGVEVRDVNSVDLSTARAGSAGDCIIRLEYGTAEVSGKVLDKKERPASDVQVIVVDARGEIVRGAGTLIDGQYRITELPPGTYRLFPVVDADISDPNTFDRLSAAGLKITLAKSAHEMRNLEVP